MSPLPSYSLPLVGATTTDAVSDMYHKSNELSFNPVGNNLFWWHEATATVCHFQDKSNPSQAERSEAKRRLIWQALIWGILLEWSLRPLRYRDRFASLRSAWEGLDSS